jgi:hypothetical protein
MLGFETIGNATIIAHDGKPVLATDPWISGEPYFGSWGKTHEIPSEQLENILNSEYIWFSHGHPDHLNADSLDRLSDKKILLPDHYGGRIQTDLANMGISSKVLPTAEWIAVSKNIRIMCLPDYNQDAVLLIAINDNLIVNFNDGSALAFKSLIRKISMGFKKRFGMKLNNYGDADMINIYDEDGSFIPPACASKPSLGERYDSLLDDFNCNFALPFSCFHQKQRSDSVWAGSYKTPMSAHFEGSENLKIELLPAFIQVDLEKDTLTEINPVALPLVVKLPEEFGDNWTDFLEKDEFSLCIDYFTQKRHLSKVFGFINLRVGGKDNSITLNKHIKTGLTFEVPRNSLMTSIKYQIFDDLLIGNFMKTTVHGIKGEPGSGLYPDFTPYVGKYADNGKAQSEEELRAYFNHYRKRAPIEFTLHRLFFHSDAAFRTMFSRESIMFQMSKKFYHFLK